MVRLEVDFVSSLSHCFVLFQFQNGTIRSTHRSLAVPVAQSFNSKMVRLEDPLSVNASGSVSCFNSKMVRLEEVTHVSQGKIIKFQFQNGTIRSILVV